MNVGSGKYHPVGSSCTYKEKTVTCLVEFSKGGGISGNIITNVLNHLNALKLYNNGRENNILPVMLVDGHGSHFDMKFLQYI